MEAGLGELQEAFQPRTRVSVPHPRPGSPSERLGIRECLLTPSLWEMELRPP